MSTEKQHDIPRLNYAHCDLDIKQLQQELDMFMDELCDYGVNHEDENPSKVKQAESDFSRAFALKEIVDLYVEDFEAYSNEVYE